MILQLCLNLFVVPKSQSLARQYIKDPNIDFTKINFRKKFINVVKNLTIFVEEYKNDNVLRKIYINEKIDNDRSKIIVADRGKIIKKDNQFFLRLYDGGITNINKKNSFALNFSETDYDLSNFSTKSITHPKTQEINSDILISCFKDFFLNIYRNSEQVFKNMIKETCEGRKLKSISDELYKRLIMPLYTLIISLIAASLIVEPKSRYFSKFHKINIFLVGSFIIVISQISLKFLLNSVNMIYLVSLMPIIFLLLFYLLLFLITKFKLNYLWLWNNMNGI